VAEDFGSLVALEVTAVVPADAGDSSEAVESLSIDGKAVDFPIALAHFERREPEFVSVGHRIS
jgi:hypothetical protein